MTDPDGSIDVNLQYKEGAAELGMLSVKESMKKRGLGKKLIEAAEERAKSSNLKAICLHLL